MSNNDGGPAFPQPLTVHPSGSIEHPSNGWGLGGMSLRDYFAAKAIPELFPQWYNNADQAAKSAYSLADAMLRAREDWEKP